MNLSYALAIALVILLFCDILDAQGSTNKKKKRKKKKKKDDFKDRLYCVQCLADYSLKKFDPTDPCINPLFNATETSLRYLTMCPKTAVRCQVEITTLNEIFTGIERRCAGVCYPTCFNKGYGLEFKVCSFCCDGIDPNDFDEETAYDYRCPKSWNNYGQVPKRLAIESWSLLLCIQFWSLYSTSH